MTEPAPGTYHHYKGNLYEVLGVATHSETEEAVVVYRALYGEFGLWVRPLDMFLGEVAFRGRSVRRFAPVGVAPVGVEAFSTEVDTGPNDTGPTDTGPTDTGLNDTGPTDTGPTDTGPTDTGPTDTVPNQDAGMPPATS